MEKILRTFQHYFINLVIKVFCFYCSNGEKSCNFPSIWWHHPWLKYQSKGKQIPILFSFWGSKFQFFGNEQSQKKMVWKKEKIRQFTRTSWLLRDPEKKNEKKRRECNQWCCFLIVTDQNPSQPCVSILPSNHDRWLAFLLIVPCSYFGQIYVFILNTTHMHHSIYITMSTLQWLLYTSSSFFFISCILLHYISQWQRFPT